MLHFIFDDLPLIYRSYMPLINCVRLRLTLAI